MSGAADPHTPRPRARRRQRTAWRGSIRVAVAVGCAAALTAGLLATANGPAAVSYAQITVRATDDAYVSQSAPDHTFDTRSLSANSISGAETVSYLKFTMPPLPEAATDVVTQLVLNRDRHRLAGPVEVSAVTDTRWSERSLTMNNAPAVGSRLGRVTPSPSTSQVSFELSPALSDGVHSFAVTSVSTGDVARFRSSESGLEGPRLVVSYQLVGQPPPAPGPGPPPPAPGGGSLSDTWIGAAVNEPGPDGSTVATVEVFNESNADIGPLAFRRSFDSSLPSSFATSAARYDAANGYRSFVSWKPPNGDFVGAAQGRYDAQVVAWAKSVPTTGIYATSFHEPENDMTGPQFVALQRHLYTVVKAANPSINWGPVYMSYWWDPAAKSHYIGNPDAWWPGNDYADFTAVDTYSAARPVALAEDPEFLGWYEYMLGVGEPMLITEYGQYAVPPGQRADPAMLTLRAEVIAADAAWLRSEGTISMWLYWDALGDQGDWRLEDTASQQAWQAVAEVGRSKW